VTGLGFIGTGHLASFFVEGLSRVDAGYDIMVSPRNAARAGDLAHRFGVAIAENQQIADRCDLVVASVLPKDAANVLGGLRFRVGQTVLSVMAGVSLSELRDLVAPAQAVVSMMPGLANAFNAGPSAMYPENAAVRSLLERLGPVHVYHDEHGYTIASVMGAFSGMTVLMMRDAMDWFASRGLEPADARRLVAEVLRGNSAMLLETPLAMSDVARGVVTPGGITEEGRKILDSGGSWSEALDAVLARVSARS
jgi:pyrroline-5-carboxylate reductase